MAVHRLVLLAPSTIAWSVLPALARIVMMASTLIITFAQLVLLDVLLARVRQFAIAVNPVTTYPMAPMLANSVL